MTDGDCNCRTVSLIWQVVQQIIIAIITPPGPIQLVEMSVYSGYYMSTCKYNDDVW